MILHRNNVKTGNWLFVHRGELPLFLIAIATLIVALDSRFFWLSDPALLYGLSIASMLFGLFIRSYAVGHASKNTSGRNTHQGQVADVLNKTGMYSLMRHPLYVGNFFMWLGVCISTASVYAIIIFVLLYIMYYEKIIHAEEDYLYNKFKEEYIAWGSDRNAVIPNFKNWTNPANPFSLKTVIRREYHGVFYFSLSLLYFSALRNYIVYDTIIPDHFVIYLFAFVAVLSIVIRVLVKKTSIFYEEDRS